MLNVISTCRDILCVDINVDKRCVDHSTKTHPIWQNLGAFLTVSFLILFLRWDGRWGHTIFFFSWPNTHTDKFSTRDSTDNYEQSTLYFLHILQVMKFKAILSKTISKCLPSYYQILFLIAENFRKFIVPLGTCPLEYFTGMSVKCIGRGGFDFGSKLVVICGTNSSDFPPPFNLISCWKSEMQIVKLTCMSKSKAVYMYTGNTLNISTFSLFPFWCHLKISTLGKPST